MQKNSISMLLIVFGVCGLIVGLLGFGVLMAEGTNGDLFDLSYSLTSSFGLTNNLDPFERFLLWCVSNRTNGLLFGVVSLVIGVILDRSAKPVSSSGHDVSKSGLANAYQGYTPSAGTSISSGPKPMSASSGVATVNAWVKENGSWMYFDAGGKLVTNAWIYTPGGHSVYVGADGKLVTNAWVEQNGKWYFVDESSGPVKNQWIEWNGARYYLDEAGYCTKSEPLPSITTPNA